MGKKGRVALALIPLVLFTACNFPAPGIGADLRQEPAEVALSIGETIAALKGSGSSRAGCLVAAGEPGNRCLHPRWPANYAWL